MYSYVSIPMERAWKAEGLRKPAIFGFFHEEPRKVSKNRDPCLLPSGENLLIRPGVIFGAHKSIYTASIGSESTK